MLAFYKVHGNFAYSQKKNPYEYLEARWSRERPRTAHPSNTYLNNITNTKLRVYRRSLVDICRACVGCNHKIGGLSEGS